MKFANIIFTRNERLTIGDDIQLLAIQQLYKEMGIDESEIIRIPFHQLSEWEGPEYVILPVAFAMYGYHTDLKITQFSPKILPVFLGLSVMASSLSEEEASYLRRFAPIGCRDAHTLKTVQKYGIPAYLNGCMTAIFPKRDDSIFGDTVYCIDVQEELMEYIPEDIKKEAVFTSHIFYANECPNGAEEKAKEVYGEYRERAKLIITSRLHGALPNAAAGIPVIWAKDKLSFRFLGVNNLLPVYTEEEWNKIDWNPQPIEYENFKKQLIENAIHRIREQYNRFHEMCTISEMYEKNQPKDYYIEFVSNTIEFLQSHFIPQEEFSYILWGVTQTAASVDDFIKTHYPNAKLAGVIDKKKRIRFSGAETSTKEVLKDKTDAWCFVCTGAAILESYQYFEEIGHRKFYQCCEDGKKHGKETEYQNAYSNVSL